MARTGRVLAHVPDASWIIALWKAIHGGDPAPSDQVAAANIVASLAPILAGRAAAELSVQTLQKRFSDIGVEITVEEAEHAAPHGAEAALRPIGPGSQFVEVCFGKPPNRRCFLVQIPRIHAPNE